jgi:hypothetical protein
MPFSLFSECPWNLLPCFVCLEPVHNGQQQTYVLFDAFWPTFRVLNKYNESYGLTLLSVHLCISRPSLMRFLCGPSRIKGKQAITSSQNFLFYRQYSD